ncbi:MAG: patatin-like phospholipase family protein [Planctomycetota bacterium]
MTPSDNGGTRLFGHDAQAVIALIRRRGERAARGQPFADPHRLGLVIEGGAMRGVLPAGGVYALARLGLGHVFDQVFATSAGVMSAAYLLSDQPETGIRVYFEHCACRRFIDQRRWWKTLDLDWLFDRVIRDAKRLDVEKLRGASARLRVAATRYDTAEACLLDANRGDTDTLDALKAAMAIPVFYNRTVPVGAHNYIDGGLQNPVPFVSALEHGCTHVLTLLAQPHDYVRDPQPRSNRLVFNLLFGRFDPARNGLLRQYHLRDHSIRQQALGSTPKPAGVSIATITAPRPISLSPFCTDARKLRDAADAYRRAVMSVFGNDPDRLALPQTMEAVNPRRKSKHFYPSSSNED